MWDRRGLNVYDSQFEYCRFGRFLFFEKKILGAYTQPRSFVFGGLTHRLDDSGVCDHRADDNTVFN